MTVLEAVDLWKLFGRTIALRNITLRFGRGLYLLLGPNGSGKTTLLKLWAGLLRPTRGKVYVKGLNPWRSRVDIMKFMSVEFEETILPWWRSGREYLRFVAKQKGVKWSNVVELAELFNVTDYWDKIIRGYSSGMKKKIIILATLMGEPEILILDEPYTLLDRNTVEKLNKLLLKMLNTVKTIVIASHVFTGIEERANGVAILINGNLVFHSTTDKLLAEGEKTYICKTTNPITLVEILFSQGVKNIRIEGNTVYFESDKHVKLPENINCSLKIDIRRIYEDILVKLK
ncbi:ATP-binding cassette domain-containing protein [Staphylothermus hellenicus]|uniref:ABC transporter related protein n=1 Tax=Staphylothermus hellenicus (strain DSM 12710 / JCM 10830 / BK20S6-10-b1 / P8) TaxID=591019 RepID=D7DC53_STAHD|nr:ABC transporter ATP-binding protein [Staphylothermus hellenicus]ADI31750.1 ABC transporter related protein [Staphylothermus hellenicus DSM 12710]